MTGAICPENGWWRSQATALPMQGGRGHFFRAGEGMPGILLRGKGSAWQQLRGAAPTCAASTLWGPADQEEARQPPSETGWASNEDKPRG